MPTTKGESGGPIKTKPKQPTLLLVCVFLKKRVSLVQFFGNLVNTHKYTYTSSILYQALLGLISVLNTVVVLEEWI